MTANDAYTGILKIGDRVMNTRICAEYTVTNLIGRSFDGQKMCVFVSDTEWFDISEIEKCK